MYILKDYSYEDNDRILGLFSTKDKIKELITRLVKDYFLKETKIQTEGILSSFSKRNDKRPYSTWYDSYYIGHIEDLIEKTNKTEEHYKHITSWFTNYLIYKVNIDEYIKDLSDSFVESSNELFTKEEINYLFDLNNYVEINKLVINILTNKEMLSHYKKELEIKLIVDQAIKLGGYKGSTSL
jgi:hypothetical protein